jgi:hypothetical protein
VLDLVWRNFTVEVADAILIGSLVQLGVGGLVGFSHFALSEDFLLAVASADVDWVEFGHSIDFALKCSLVATCYSRRGGRNCKRRGDRKGIRIH